MNYIKSEDMVEFLEYIKLVYGKDFIVEKNLDDLDTVVRASSEKAKVQTDLNISQEVNKLSESDSSNNNSLLQFYKEIENCQKCELGKTRRNLVFGSGAADADLMIIGEAPGADEDASGKPFVGKAGQLLTKILAAIGLSRDEVFIANILKCRPPGNRDPLPGEVLQCRPHLNRQIELIKPKVILLLGRVAAQTLFETNDSLKDMRGRLRKYQDIDVFVTYHPAALLRNPHWKRPTWEDMKKVKSHLIELNSGMKNG